MVGSASYEELTGVSAGKDGRRSLLRVELGERGCWVLDGLHPLTKGGDVRIDVPLGLLAEIQQRDVVARRDSA